MNARKLLYTLAALWLLSCVYADVVRPRMIEQVDRPSAAYAAYVTTVSP